MGPGAGCRGSSSGAGAHGGGRQPGLTTPPPQPPAPSQAPVYVPPPPSFSASRRGRAPCRCGKASCAHSPARSGSGVWPGPSPLRGSRWASRAAGARVRPGSHDTIGTRIGSIQPRCKLAFPLSPTFRSRCFFFPIPSPASSNARLQLQGGGYTGPVVPGSCSHHFGNRGITCTHPCTPTKSHARTHPRTCVHAPT